MLVKVAELIGPALDWAVAKCEGENGVLHDDGITRCIVIAAPSGVYKGIWRPSINWAQGGPIVYKNPRISPTYDERFDSWFAYKQSPALYGKQSFLVSAMRAYVASKLDTEIEIPNSLFKG